MKTILLLLALITFASCGNRDDEPIKAPTEIKNTPNEYLRPWNVIKVKTNADQVYTYPNGKTIKFFSDNRFEYYDGDFTRKGYAKFQSNSSFSVDLGGNCTMNVLVTSENSFTYFKISYSKQLDGAMVGISLQCN